VYKIDTTNSVVGKPAPSALGTEGFFTDAVGGNPGTTVDADWMNALQGSLIAILDDQSVAHSKTDFSKLLLAIKSLIDQKIALAGLGRRGFIDGLLFEPGSGGAFNITPGLCRDATNVDTGILSVLKAKDAAVAWATGTGALAQNNTWADPYYGNVFAMLKSDLSGDINFGVDQSNTAANLMLDGAASGFDLYRQIGFIVRDGSTDMIPYANSAPAPARFVKPAATLDFDAAVSGTTIQTRDVKIPAGTYHLGTHLIASDDTSPADLVTFCSLGGTAATVVPTSTLHNAVVQVLSTSGTSDSIPLTSYVEAGTATLQGQVSARFAGYLAGLPTPVVGGNLNWALSTNGYLYSRGVA
jgi:hypothetical protein